MKIKIIDLLNKIANGEKGPEKIKYNNEIYKRYQNISTNNLYYYQVPNKCNLLIDQLSSASDLLDEVEIIEEPKKIEKIKQLNNVVGCKELIELKDKQQINNHILKDKINELIYAINELKRNK